SSLTVIEYETLGAVAMAESFAFLSFIAMRSGLSAADTPSDIRTYRRVAVNDCRSAETVFHHTRERGAAEPLPGNAKRPAPPEGDAGLFFS
ncbi:hypothetical protein ACPXCX_52880, partial [Streptomyces sp. DT225]